MVARAKEEILLLKAETFNTQMYYKNMSDGVEAARRKVSEEGFHNNFTRGCRALLTNTLIEIHRHMKLCYLPTRHKDCTLGIGLITGTINCEFCDLGQNRNT